MSAAITVTAIMGFMLDVLVLMYSDTEMWHKDRELAYVLLMGWGLVHHRTPAWHKLLKVSTPTSQLRSSRS